LQICKHLYGKEVVDAIAGDRERRHHPRRGSQAGVSKGSGLQRASSLGLSTGTHELLLILSRAIPLLGALVVALGLIRPRPERLTGPPPG
jgi:hypothetical protein